jgi:hypothetical protein
MLINMLNQPLMHQQDMRPSTHIRMDRHWEHKLIILAVEVVEVVAPDGLDEHHGGEVVEIPVCGDLDHTGGLAVRERFHPRVGRLGVVDLGPGVAGAEVVGLAVVVVEAVVVFDAVAEVEGGGFAADFPPGGDAATRGFATAEGGEEAIGFVEDVGLLLEGHGGGVFVAVAVEADFVAGVADHGAFFGEGFEAMAGDEPGGFDVVFGEEGEEAAGADCASEEACWGVRCE